MGFSLVSTITSDKQFFADDGLKGTFVLISPNVDDSAVNGILQNLFHELGARSFAATCSEPLLCGQFCKRLVTMRAFRPFLKNEAYQWSRVGVWHNVASFGPVIAEGGSPNPHSFLDPFQHSSFRPLGPHVVIELGKNRNHPLHGPSHGSVIDRFSGGPQFGA